MLASVVVPTYRRPDLLARCLRALSEQDFDAAAYEVIVADDAASASTRQQVSQFAATARPSVIYAPATEGHGPAAARNVGWRRARGAIIAFTDDDCVPERGWLAAGVAHFQREPEVVALAGKVRVPLPSAPTDYERDAAGLETAEFVTANCFCRRPALEKVGGFDERFQAAWREDSDLHFALLTLPGELRRAEDAAVIHPLRPAAWGISLRQQRKSLFDALLYKKHPVLYRSRIQPGTPWRYYAMVAALLSSSEAVAVGWTSAALGCLGIWGLMTASFCARRLQQTSRAPSHVAEMVVTSMLIPPLSVFWRLYGAWKFRVFFL
jgi:glycosyltransferase involved in cell wall biosynthesis